MKQKEIEGKGTLQKEGEEKKQIDAMWQDSGNEGKIEMNVRRLSREKGKGEKTIRKQKVTAEKSSPGLLIETRRLRPSSRTLPL